MKKWILTAVVLVIAGAVICFAAAASMGFDLRRLDTGKYETNTYWGIIGFVIGSAILIILQNFFMVDMHWTSIGTILGGTSVVEYIVGVVLAVLAFLGAYKLGDK